MFGKKKQEIEGLKMRVAQLEALLCPEGHAWVVMESDAIPMNAGGHIDFIHTKKRVCTRCLKVVDTVTYWPE